MSFVRFFLRAITAPFRWLLSLPVWVVSAPRRVLGLSMPMRGALLVLFVLLICTIISIIIEVLPHDGVEVSSWFGNWPGKVMVILIFVIPVAVYFWLKMWMEGDVSRYPALDDAWADGVKALESKGIDITTTPLFLVIGSSSEKAARSLFQASSLDLDVAQVPQGKSPFQWFSDGESIFIVCHDCSCLSVVNRQASALGPTTPTSQPDLRGTAASGQDGIRGTMVAGGGTVRSSAAFASAEEDEPADANMLRGTLVAGAPSGGGGPAAPAGPAGGSGGLLPRREADEQSERIGYLCHLIRQVRQPVCPLNGILTVLPFDVIQNVMAAREMPTAVKRDLDAIRDETRLRCPVTVLVVGMENETGFSELVRRVGASRAKANRFGKGYDVWNAPTGENMDALSAHACGAFEDWVYNLFREKDGLNKPGNAKLYSLLCKIRSNLRSRLRGILLNGFSFDPNDKSASPDKVLFGGCYFAATGDSEDRQAFVKSVFEKMLEMEEELDWTDEAWDEDDRYHGMAKVGMAYSGLMVLALAGMLIYRFVIASS